MDSIIGSFLFEFIGALLKWFFYAIIHFVKGEKLIPFGEIYSEKNSSKFHDRFLLGVSNIFIGFSFCFVVIITLVFFII